MYKVKFSRTFKKNIKDMQKQGKNTELLWLIVDLLAEGKPLPARNRDHALVDSKDYKGCRECHIAPDWLLIYKRVKKS